MRIARLAFLTGNVLQRAPPGESDDLRAVPERRKLFGTCASAPGYMAAHQVIEEFERASKRGQLRFVPSPEDLHDCVKALQQNRANRHAHAAPSRAASLVLIAQAFQRAAIGRLLCQSRNAAKPLTPP